MIRVRVRVGSFSKIKRILPYLHEEKTGKPEQCLGGHEGLDDDELQHVEVEGDQGYDPTSLLGRDQLDIIVYRDKLD